MRMMRVKMAMMRMGKKMSWRNMWMAATCWRRWAHRRQGIRMMMWVILGRHMRSMLVGTNFFLRVSWW